MAQAAPQAPLRQEVRGHKLTQLQRLQALSVRAEYLWSLVIERLQISEREISRTIQVWGAAGLPEAVEAIPRDKIVADLTSPGTPYWRLKTVMDAWCALWFWPLDQAALLDGSHEVYKTPLVQEPEPVPVDPDPCSPRCGRWTPSSARPRNSSPSPKRPPASPAPSPPSPTTPRPLGEPRRLARLRRSPPRPPRRRPRLPGQPLHLPLRNGGVRRQAGVRLLHAHGPSMAPTERFPWLDTVEQIAADQGFFHWELRFASVFADGGFDLQVGNPPWVRPAGRRTRCSRSTSPGLS